jgi:hypothetical protein
MAFDFGEREFLGGFNFPEIIFIEDFKIHLGVLIGGLIFFNDFNRVRFFRLRRISCIDL